jgi:hypothetical protein
MAHHAGILKRLTPIPPDTSLSNKHIHNIAQEAKFINTHTPHNIIVSVSCHKLEVPRSPTGSTSSSERRTSRKNTAEMTKRRPSASKEAIPSKKQRASPPADAHDSSSPERESREVSIEEQQDSDAPIDDDEEVTVVDNGEGAPIIDGAEEAPVLEVTETTKPKTRETCDIDELYTPFADDKKPTEDDLKDVKILDFWGIRPTSKDKRPKDLHADQPSARASNGQTNPELWEDRKFRFKPSKLIKYHGNVKPDGLDENNAPDIDQEENLIYPLLKMRNGKREPKRYWYLHGVPKDWTFWRTLKAVNDRRVQAIERNCQDPPWNKEEREYLAELLRTNPDASIWKLTQLINDYFKGVFDETWAGPMFCTNQEALSLFAHPGRTVESVRAQYMSYKVSYDKGMAPEGVREKKDKTDRFKKLEMLRRAYIRKGFGPPHGDDSSSSSEDDDKDDDKDNDEEDDDDQAGGNSNEKIKVKKKKDEKETKKQKKNMLPKKDPKGKKPATNKEKVVLRSPSPEDTYQDIYERLYNNLTVTQTVKEVKARNLCPKPQPKKKEGWTAILARDDFNKKRARKNIAAESGAGKEPTPNDDSDSDSAAGERALQQDAAAIVRSQSPQDSLGENILELGGVNNPDEIRRERTPPRIHAGRGDASDSDISDPPTNIESPTKESASSKRKLSKDAPAPPPKRMRREPSPSRSDSSEDAFEPVNRAALAARQEARRIDAASKAAADKLAARRAKAAIKRAEKKAEAAEKAAADAVAAAKKDVAEKIDKGETRGAVRTVLNAGGPAVKAPVVKKSNVKVVIEKKAVFQTETTEVAAPAPAAPAPNAIRAVEINEDDYSDDEGIFGPDADAEGEEEDDETRGQRERSESWMTPSEDDFDGRPDADAVDEEKDSLSDEKFLKDFNA